jgi:hypothetical protein
MCIIEHYLVDSLAQILERGDMREGRTHF